MLSESAEIGQRKWELYVVWCENIQEEPTIAGYTKWLKETYDEI